MSAGLHGGRGLPGSWVGKGEYGGLPFEPVDGRVGERPGVSSRELRSGSRFTGSAEVAVLSSELFDPQEKLLAAAVKASGPALGGQSESLMRELGPSGPLVRFRHGLL